MTIAYETKADKKIKFIRSWKDIHQLEKLEVN